MAPISPTSDVGAALALAVIASSQAPLLLLDDSFQVVSASESFLRDYGLEAGQVRGRSIFTLGAGEWDLPRLRSLLTAVASGDAEVDAYELALPRLGQKPRTLLLNAHRLDFTDGRSIRLLLTLVDVTEARAAEKLKNDLIREKDILLQELQHRVANSLQIVASVLMQSARKVQSEETRGHLTAAHSRVMSVAAVQQQLSASRLGDVIIKPYFTQLCLSLGASMIADPDQLSIEVTGDGSSTGSDVSVSLGLIVTELVINALKHAFPDGRPGSVTVDYRSTHEGWTLSVADDGVGMPPAQENAARAGLGTAIVQALSAQLEATITVTDRHPGTAISVTHRKAQHNDNAAALRAV